MKRLLLALALMASVVSIGFSQDYSPTVFTLNASNQTGPITPGYLDIRGLGLGYLAFGWNATGTVSAGACALQGSADTTTFGTTIIAAQTVTSSGGPTTLTATGTSNYIRIRCTTAIVGSGSVQFKIYGWVVSPPSSTVTVSGTVDENLKQVNGQTVNVGTGAAGTGTLRITTSTDSTIATITNPVTVTDGAGALNVIVDSGTLTAVTSITNPVTVTDGAGALNVIVDSSALPSGAATDASLTNGNQKVQVYYGGTSTPILSTDVAPVSAASGAFASGSHASGSMASGAYASGSIASGAYASGSIGSGAIASGAVASGAIASGAVASGAIASGAYAAGSLNSAIPDPCFYTAKTPLTINFASSSVQTIIASSSSNKVYLCELFIFSTTAQNIAIAEDATAACASLDAGIIGGTTTGTGINFAATQGVVMGNGLGTIAKSASTNVNLCMISSSTGQVTGNLMYVLAP